VNTDGPQLPDREALLARLDCVLPTGQRTALLIVNLDNFRGVNIDFGYRFGDQVLVQTGKRIESVLREGDCLYHIGADEFAVVLTTLRSSQLAELAAIKIQHVVGGNLSIHDNVLALSVRVGVAIFPDHAVSCERLMQLADAALQNVRANPGSIKVYDRTLGEQELQRSGIKAKLKEALERSDLTLYYQPQMNLQQGVISGCEALARWCHAEKGWISPEVFIPVAEESGLIDDLTYWSVNAALRERLQTIRGCFSQATVSVNLSAKLLHSAEVVDLIERAINIWGATPGSLVLEVTESAMMSDPKSALNTLLSLADLGVKLSIDDFGTGYSSLAYLKNLPVAELKIDKSFVLHMAEAPQDRKIVQSVIDLAHNLDLQVVAEGIENQQSLDMLVNMGCDYGQGYYIARPMPLDELPLWAAGSRWQRPVTP